VRAISQFVVNVCDLFEAEGRSLRAVIRGEATRARAATTSMAFGLLLALIAVPIVVGGVGLLAVSLLWALERPLGLPLAAAITGGALVAAGAGLLAVCAAGARRPTA